MTFVRVVDIIPAERSDEAGLNWQPSIAVNPDNPDQIVITTTDVPPPANVGYWYSCDRGGTWQANFSEPDGAEEMDQSTGLAASGELYWAVALNPPSNTPTLHVLRTPNLVAAGPFPDIDTRLSIDQPYTLAFTQHQSGQPDTDRTYVGYIDHSGNMGDSAAATIDVCPDAQAAAPVFARVVLDHRASVPWNGYEVRPTVHSDGTAYVAYKGWRSYNGTTVITDIVVERDDSWGSGGFIDLTDPSDGKPGRLVATNVRIKDPQSLDGQRLDNDLSLCVDPSNSNTVYLVWGDNSGENYTLRVRRSLDRGACWSSDLLTVGNANLAGLAINSDGRVGFVYQQLVSGQWETHFRRTTDATGENWDDIILARTATTTDSVADYSRVISVGKDFYGVFPAWNTPDPANFPATPATASNPNGAKFLRGTTSSPPWQLLGASGQPVAESVDPFFYLVQDESTPAPPTGLTATTQ
ncbi:MAG TPA: hypothetical protein VEI01_24600 [Terriglobales bacterium]|nr:hypothetical protein [Terriglobales bacterium]